MSALLKRLRDAIWPENLRGQYFVSRAHAEDIERLMPGEVLMIGLQGRNFIMMEREEFELILKRASMSFKTRV